LFHFLKLTKIYWNFPRKKISFLEVSKRSTTLQLNSQIAPALFNILCINDQPITNDKNTKHFIYDVALPDKSFETIESKLSKSLNELGRYFQHNYLWLKGYGPKNCRMCTHLKNDVKWCIDLENDINKNFQYFEVIYSVF